MSKKEEKRTYPIRVYLEKTDHVEAIKKMMVTLYPEVSQTMDEWEIIDNEINNRRC